MTHTVSSASHSPSARAVHADDGVVVTPAALESVAARIAARCGSYFPGTSFASSPPHVALRRLGETSSYPLFLAEASAPDATRRAMVVKFAPVFDQNNEGLTEYRHLSAMYDRLGAAGELRVPRPLDFYPEVNALVMERVGGERLSRVLLRDGGRFATPAAAHRLEDAARRCGAWLSIYHQVTMRGEAAPFDDAFAARVDEKLELFTRHGFCRDAARLVRVTARELNAFGRGRLVAVADMHGDYGPQNVHAGDGFVYVFDLNYSTPAPIYEDVDYFLVTLETMNPYPRQLLFERARVRGLGRRFLSGYFGNGDRDPLRELYLAGYYLKSLLFRCAKQRRNTAKRGRAALWAFDAVRTRRYYPQRLAAQCRTVEGLLSGARAGGSG